MSKSRSVTSLEQRAPIYIDPRERYVDITQPRGDRTKYTPAEARRLAAELLAAAEEVEGGGTVEQ
ncbi:hypothetical protein [Haloglomus halophilum]|uniref:hypothetical protein n=1 Tax=Haloglomus halophilum TaxID=2962672 RepID=UPI0020C98A24|nr:hypothetical protein [Haloglomus halophilum]